MIKTEVKHVQVGAMSHPGMTGKNNEDRYAINGYRLSSSNPTPVTFAVVCDGIGGNKSGELAADLAIEKVLNTVGSSFGDLPLKTMLLALQSANEAIYSTAQQAESYRGMGATIAMVWMESNRLFTTTIGDTRIYLIRDKGIRQVSTDHTWVQEALANGKISRDEAENHPNAHVIRRYLGAPMVPAADQRLNLRKGESDADALANQGVELWAGDIVLVCTDGLTDHVADREIVEVLTQQRRKPQPTVDALVKLACDRGGKDNITVVMLQIPENKNPLAKLFDKLK